MITGRALLNVTLSRVLFALGVLGVIAVITCHSVTLDRPPVVTMTDGPTVQQLVTAGDAVEVRNAVAPWKIDMSEVPLAMPSPAPNHSEAACKAFLSAALLLLGWAACRLITSKRQFAPRSTAIRSAVAPDSVGWWLLSPAKLGILRI